MHRIIAIPTAEAERFAATNEIVTASSERTGPCRHCLRIGTPGERLALGTYAPFAGLDTPYAESGPVFVHADGCTRFSDAPNEPLASPYGDRRFLLRAYDDRHWIHDAQIAEAGTLEAGIAAMFADERVRYIHARHVLYQCYGFRVERA